MAADRAFLLCVSSNKATDSRFAFAGNIAYTLIKPRPHCSAKSSYARRESLSGQSELFHATFGWEMKKLLLATGVLFVYFARNCQNSRFGHLQHISSSRSENLYFSFCNYRQSFSLLCADFSLATHAADWRDLRLSHVCPHDCATMNTLNWQPPLRGLRPRGLQ